MILTKGQAAFLKAIAAHSFNIATWVTADGKPPTAPMQVLAFRKLWTLSGEEFLPAHEFARIEHLVGHGTATDTALKLNEAGVKVMEA